MKDEIWAGIDPWTSQICLFDPLEQVLALNKQQQILLYFWQSTLNYYHNNAILQLNTVSLIILQMHSLCSRS